MLGEYQLKIEDKNGQLLYERGLEKEFYRVGRQHDNDFVLEDVKLSRQHAKFVIREGGVFVVDLNSKNGVYVNGRRIPPGEPGVLIQVGDEVQMGSHRIFLLRKAPSPSRSPVSSAPALPGQKQPPASSAVALPGYTPQGGGFDVGGGTMVIGGADADEELYSAAYVIKQTQPRLVYVIEGKARERYELQKTNCTIGAKGSGHDIEIDHKSVSKNHARILLRGTYFFIKDWPSTNGVTVNDTRLPKGGEAKIENNTYLLFGGVGAVFFQNPHGISTEPEGENLLRRLLVMGALTEHQAASIEEDLEKGYLVGESALLKGYCTPAEWYKIYTQAKSVQLTQNARDTSLLLMVAIGIGVLIVLLLIVVILLFSR